VLCPRFSDALLARLIIVWVIPTEMSELAGQVPDAQKYHYYALAKQIAAADGLTTAEKIALQELSGALKITYDPEIFDIPEHDFD
jgi:hypothetical protein